MHFSLQWSNEVHGLAFFQDLFWGRGESIVMQISFVDFSNPLDQCILLNQLFELFSAVGSISQINNTGNIHFSSFWIYGQKPLCEIGTLKFPKTYEGLKMTLIRLLIYMVSASFVSNLASLP